MGTRSLTFVYDDSSTDDGSAEAIMCIYRQYDGYPSGHGHELAQFLNSKTIVNGYGEQNSMEANGMSCLAAQLVVQLKHGVGGIYIYPVSSTDCFQDYEYHVYEDKVVVKDPTAVIFEGTWEDFAQFCLDPISAG
jgi:hypothetical protein